MLTELQDIDWWNKITNPKVIFEDKAKEIFVYQYMNNPLIKKFFNVLCNQDMRCADTYKFLPISFFKTHDIFSTKQLPTIFFESSGTTSTSNSKHFVENLGLYEKSFFTAFNLKYGNIKDCCVIGLLPSYLQQNNSSLVYMVNALIKESNHPKSSFYLNDFEALSKVLVELQQLNKKTIIIGVTYALLDFAIAYPMQWPNLIVMETGGMKGRKKELLRQEVHDVLKANFGVKEVHSEYGMTELLSQAYAKKDGIFECPPWMKVLVREVDNPLDVKLVGKGLLNIIDLANVHSCSFIATDDVGIVYEDGSFEVIGRLDNSDLRGCSLMYS